MDGIRANKLSLSNPQKTKYMLFSNTIEALPMDVIFDDTPLEKLVYIKFLGIIVDTKLSWKLHIVNICKTISRNIDIISKIPYSSFILVHALFLFDFAISNLRNISMG